MIYLALYKGSGTFFDKLIRFITRQPYSHCELQIRGVCYQSQPRDGGVRQKVMELDPEKWDLVPLPEYNEADAITWFIKNEGKKYDWPGAITSVLPLHINIPSRYFCSEACQHMLGIKDPKSQKPQQLAKLFMK